MFWREGRSTQATCCLDRAARSLSLKGLHGSARGYPAPLLVAHELGHYFGLNEDQLAAMGYE